MAEEISPAPVLRATALPVRNRPGLAGRDVLRSRLQPCCRRDGRHPARGHPLDRGRLVRLALPRRLSPVSSGATVRPGHRPKGGGGIRAGAGRDVVTNPRSTMPSESYPHPHAVIMGIGPGGDRVSEIKDEEQAQERMSSAGRRSIPPSRWSVAAPSRPVSTRAARRLPHRVDGEPCPPAGVPLTPGRSRGTRWTGSRNTISGASPHK